MKKSDNWKLILDDIRNKFGKEAVTLLDKDSVAPIEVIPSGSHVIDSILGIGGYPKGRIIEIYGSESCGKTTMALHAIAQAQKLNGLCVYIDAEHSIDPSYAKNLDVDVNNLLISQPDSGEQALEIVDMLVKTNKISLIVVDSVAALVPKAELEAEMSESSIGLQARLMSKALRKITGNLNKSNTTIIFINQLREKVGVFFGNPEITPGGRALKFYSSIRMQVKRIKNIGIGKNIEGDEIRIKIVKNKLAPPYKVGETKIFFSKGIWSQPELLAIAEDYGVIRRLGAWYSYKKRNFAKGQMNAFKYLENNPEFVKEIKSEIRKKQK